MTQSFINGGAARPLAHEELAALTARFEAAGGEATTAVLRWAQDSFAPDIALACSFGGTSGMVLVDLASKLGLNAEVFYLDTDVLFPETYRLRDQVAQRYGFSPVGYRSRIPLSEQAEQYGEALWQRDPNRCCYLRKVEPNERALAGKRAWITGIRRDQSATRREVSFVEWDNTFDLIKINALATWSEDEVWEYIHANDVPYNPLHDQGYPSLGCVPCTRAVKPGEDRRAGRWSGFDKTECGLHVQIQSPS